MGFNKGRSNHSWRAAIMRHLLILVSLLLVGSVWAEEKNEEPKADAPSLKQLLNLILDEQSAEFLLNPSQFSRDEIGLREFARKECESAGKDWKISNENVPELIQKARANLDQGKISVAQEIYLRYLRRFPQSDEADEEEPFIYEAASSWALPYAYLYASARKSAVETDVDREIDSSVDDALNEAIECSSHVRFRDGIKAKVNKEENPFAKFREYVNEIRDNLNAAAKKLQLDADLDPLWLAFSKDIFTLDDKWDAALAWGVVETGGYGLWALFSKTTYDANENYNRANTALCKSVYGPLKNEKYLLETKKISNVYVEAFNSRRAIRIALNKIEKDPSSSLSSEIIVRLSEFRQQQRIHYEVIDNLLRIYVYDMPMSLAMVGVEANMKKAKSPLNDDEMELNQAGLDFCRFRMARDKIVDKKFTHAKWMEINRRLKGEFGNAAWEDLKVQADTLPDVWDMPDNHERQESRM